MCENTNPDIVGEAEKQLRTISQNAKLLACIGTPEGPSGQNVHIVEAVQHVSSGGDAVAVHNRRCRLV